MTTLDYLLRANLYLILFFGCYYLLLRRHTFFMLNRVYLLASVGLALGLPFVELPTETVVVLPTVAPQLLTGVTIRPENLASTGPNWVSIAWWVYGVVAAGLLVRLFWRTTRLLNFIRQNPQQPLPHYTLVQPADPETPTFSFFRYMVLSPADAQAEPVQAHELVHIRQWHSADVLAFEVIQALLWFNPVVLAYRLAIRQVHEFLADQAASARHRSDYANYLVSYALGDQPDLLTNSFFKPSLLTARLRMLHQRATSHWALSKYALVLPLTLLALALTAARPEVERLVEPLLSVKPVPMKGRVMTEDNKTLPGATIVIKNGNAGTTTDANGRFMINAEPGAELVVSFVGFESQQITAKAGEEMQVMLKIKPQRLTNIVSVVNDPITYLKNADNKVGRGEVFRSVEQQPEFPGGTPALNVYLLRNIRYPVEAVKSRTEGEVLVEFIVSPTGAINNIRIKKGVGNGCDEEAVRVVAQMPRWEPGKQNGQPVAVVYTLSIGFMLELNGKKIGVNKEIFDNPSFPAPTNDPNTVIPALNYTLEPKPGIGNVISPGTRITIRGNKVGFGDNPLYIIDGVPMGKDYSVNTLEPKDIQSISVLKNSSASSLYGEKGADGVIIITTKKSKQHDFFKPAEPIKH
jgi:TonB family protein